MIEDSLVSAGRCRGVLHPLHYDCLFVEANSFPRLESLCCDLILSKSLVTKGFLTVLPPMLYALFLRRAARKNYDLPLDFMLSLWPWRELRLVDVFPPVFETIQAAYDKILGRESVKRGIEFTRKLVRCFIKIVQTLEMKSNRKLRVFDMRGFPVDDEVAKTLAQEIHSCLINHHQLSEKEKLHIVLDCIVADERTYNVLLQPNCVCSIHINKLYLSSHGFSSIESSLKRIDSSELNGLKIMFTSFWNDGIQVIQLVPVLYEFKSLVALDFSLSNLNLNAPYNYDVCNSLVNLFNNLGKLRRLDLSLISMRNSVHRILPANILFQLESLRLTACQLSEADMKYLNEVFSSVMNVSPKLYELSLSHTYDLVKDLNVLQNLLKRISSSLRILELKHCKFTAAHLPSLVSFLLDLPLLRVINLSLNSFSPHTLCEQMNRLSRHESLQCVLLTYPLECYLPGLVLNIESVKTMQRGFSDQMKRRVTFNCISLYTFYHDQWDL